LKKRDRSCLVLLYRKFSEVQGIVKKGAKGECKGGPVGNEFR